MKIFGEKLAGQLYLPRPGAYGLCHNAGRIAVVQLSQGVFLLGGGVKSGETPEAALVREVLEETGFGATLGGRLWEAGQYCFSNFHQKHFLKTGVFYELFLTPAPVREPLNQDHLLSWLTIEEAVYALKHDYQKEAVRRFQEHLTATKSLQNEDSY